jgi:hypothetical protein
MRPQGFLVARSAELRKPQVPAGRIMDFGRRHRRRLGDSLADIFTRAVASNNLDGAADLLTILEKWQQRRVTKYGRERRISDAELKAMRADLDRLTAVRIS